MASLASGATITTRDLLRSGDITSKEGFSVVAPISVISPLSTCGKKASCCALLNLCISSTKRTVRVPRFQFTFARATTFSTSFFPAVTAEISIKSAPNSLAIILAKVVLPVPGGPQNIRLVGSFLFTISVKILPSPIISSCPTTLSKLSGLILSANGTLFISYIIYIFYHFVIFYGKINLIIKENKCPTMNYINF